MAPLEDRLEMSLAEVIQTHWSPAPREGGARGAPGQGKGKTKRAAQPGGGRKAAGGRGAPGVRKKDKYGTVVAAGRGRGRGKAKAAGRGAAPAGRGQRLPLWRGAASAKGKGKGNVKAKGVGRGAGRGKGKGKGKAQAQAKGKGKSKAKGKGWAPPSALAILPVNRQGGIVKRKGAGRGMKGRGRAVIVGKGGKKGWGQGTAALKGGKASGGANGYGKGYGYGTKGAKSWGSGAKAKGRGKGMKGWGRSMDWTAQGAKGGQMRREEAEGRWQHDKFEGGKGEEDAWSRARGARSGKGKGNGKGYGDDHSDVGRPDNTRGGGRGGPAERMLSSDDRRLMKKITIVAQLDKVPKPPQAMQGMALGRGKRSSSQGEGTLSSRFGANHSR